MILMLIMIIYDEMKDKNADADQNDGDVSGEPEYEIDDLDSV